MPVIRSLKILNAPCIGFYSHFSKNPTQGILSAKVSTNFAFFTDCLTAVSDEGLIFGLGSFS